MELRALASVIVKHIGRDTFSFTLSLESFYPVPLFTPQSHTWFSLVPLILPSSGDRVYLPYPSIANFTG